MWNQWPGWEARQEGWGGGLDVQSGQVPKEVKDKRVAARHETGASTVWVRNERLGAPWP